MWPASCYQSTEVRLLPRLPIPWHEICEELNKTVLKILFAIAVSFHRTFYERLQIQFRFHILDGWHRCCLFRVSCILDRMLRHNCIYDIYSGQCNVASCFSLFRFICMHLWNIDMYSVDLPVGYVCVFSNTLANIAWEWILSISACVPERQWWTCILQMRHVTEFISPFSVCILAIFSAYMIAPSQ